jgi:hypothetical protein
MAGPHQPPNKGMDMFHGREQPLSEYEGGGAVDDPDDATPYWNTPLDPEQEAQFQDWAQKNNHLRDLYDYDMRGAWREGISPDPQTQHWPDTYKKPNHPTFSEESIYHGSEGHMGGYWDTDETGTETLQPYDPKRDPQALERSIDAQTKFVPVQRAAAGITEESNVNDVVDRLRHPTYQQLAEDKDLRRGRTRMAPRGAGAEGGFGYAQGGKVESIQQKIDDPEHGSWHDDGRYHIYTPHPSFFADVDPRDLVEHFDRHHPEDHKLNLP